MARTGFVVGLGIPLALLGANLILSLGGILVTALLFVWIGVGVMVIPTTDEEA